MKTIVEISSELDALHLRMLEGTRAVGGARPNPHPAVMLLGTDISAVDLGTVLIPIIQGNLEMGTSIYNNTVAGVADDATRLAYWRAMSGIWEATFVRGLLLGRLYGRAQVEEERGLDGANNKRSE